jgi:hypothetical protein
MASMSEPQSAAELYNDWQADLAISETWPAYEGLSVRARHALYGAKLRDKETIRANVGKLSKIHNIGKLTRAEILRWLGVPDPVVCPRCGQPIRQDEPR